MRKPLAKNRFMEDQTVQQFRVWIIRCGWLAGILMLGCAVFGSLWSGLAGLGDVAGASFCQGIFWGAVVCWCLNGVVLIGLLTTVVLFQSRPDKDIQPIFPSN